MKLPASVRSAVQLAFFQSNDLVSKSLSTQPAYREPDLDTKFVEALGPFNRGVAVKDCYVRVDCLRIGSLHLHDKREAGDIALVGHFYAGGILQKKKLVILQSKRLGSSTELIPGAGKVEAFRPHFRYPAFKKDQQEDIDAFMRRYGIPVAYLLYNPWRLPLLVKPPGVNEAEQFMGQPSRRLPLLDDAMPHNIQFGLDYAGKKAVGARVVPARDVHGAMGSKVNLTYEALLEIEGFEKGRKRAGWRVEDFVANVFLLCEVGKEVTDSDKELAHFDAALTAIGERALSAVVVVTIDAPKGFRFD